MFVESTFGLLMNGLPATKPGQKLDVDGSRSVSMPFVTDPNGRKMIKACADPELFDISYPGCINVTMNGRQLLGMAEKIPEAEGILICSATSFHSFPIYRTGYRRLKSKKGQANEHVRKWWQFWKLA
jgi:hypothetical protein